MRAARATATFTTTKPFDQLELAAGGLLNAYSLGLVEAYADVAAPLPVELVDFRGQATPAGVQLSWQTASELNSCYFAIERASSAEVDFAELGRVVGAGTSSQAHRYQFVDTRPGTLNYYRLRQVDADGTAHYSPVVAVRAVPSARLQAYPSPATTTLQLTGSPVASLSLLDQQGRLLRQTMLEAGQHSLDISSLLSGTYFLRDDATGQSARFVKINE